MVKSDILICPNCGEQIPITETLTASVEKKITAKLKREAGEALKKKSIELELKVKADNEKNAKSYKKEIEKEFKAQIKKHESEKRNLQGELKEMVSREKDVVLKEQEIKGMEKDIKKRINSEVNKKAKAEKAKLSLQFQEEYESEIDKKERQLATTRKQVRDLKQKLDQGSQQEQGEILEEKIEKILATEFPMDQISEVAKGKMGGDVIQEVVTKSGKSAGKIVWELKNTKTFSKAWIAKLKKDMRSEKADLGVIASVALPKEVDKGFSVIDGVWVTDIKHVVPLAFALRKSLLDIHGVKSAINVSDKQLQVIFEYLTGVEFKNRIEAIVEAFSEMGTNIEKERLAAEKNWSKREQSIKMVLSNLAGMYGEIEVIAGAKLPTIKKLELTSGK
jgi:hypothetical protein